MLTNNISGMPSTPPSYTPPSTSRFLAFGKLNPKYPPGLGKSLPSTFSEWSELTREIAQRTLSPFPSDSVSRSTSGSFTSESVPGSLQSSPLLPNNRLPAQSRKLVVDDQASTSDAEPEASPLQLGNALALYIPQDLVSHPGLITTFSDLKSLLDIDSTSFYFPPYTQSPKSQYVSTFLSSTRTRFANRILQPGSTLYYVTSVLRSLGTCCAGI